MTRVELDGGIGAEITEQQAQQNSQSQIAQAHTRMAATTAGNHIHQRLSRVRSGFIERPQPFDIRIDWVSTVPDGSATTRSIAAYARVRASPGSALNNAID